VQTTRAPVLVQAVPAASQRDAVRYARLELPQVSTKCLLMPPKLTAMP
jgi:hypothetical protein